MSRGKFETTAVSAIRKGDLVIADASQGYATATIPSPKFEIAVALHNFQYEAPSWVFTFNDFTVTPPRSFLLRKL
jgi:hypothetical protein